MLLGHGKFFHIFYLLVNNKTGEKGEQAFVDDFERLCIIAHTNKFSLVAAVVLAFYKQQSNFLYQATLSINRRETCTLVLKKTYYRKILQTSS